MKKSKLTVLSLALISGMLASCGNSAVSYERSFKHILEANAEDSTTRPGEPEVHKDEDGEIILINDPATDPKVIGVQSLEIDVPVFSLFYSPSKISPFAETKQLNAIYKPYTAKASAFVWSSDNPSVATVDEKTGLVKAVSAGVANISVTSEDGFVATSHCVVNNANESVAVYGKAPTQILADQKLMDYPEKIYVREDYLNTKVIGDAVVETTKFAQNIWASKKEAYMRITSDDQEVKCEGGSLVLGAVDYIFYTTELYYTYVFSTKATNKTYMIVDQSNLADKGTSRYDAMCLVLNSFFTSGKAIIENQYRDIFSSDDLQKSAYSGAKYAGSLGQTSKQFAYNQISGGVFTIDWEDEEDLGIPAGTKVQLTDDIRYLWENNLISAKRISEKLDYKFEGKDACVDYLVDYYYQSENVELLYPKLSDYTKVADIFSL